VPLLELVELELDVLELDELLDDAPPPPPLVSLSPQATPRAQARVKRVGTR